MPPIDTGVSAADLGASPDLMRRKFVNPQQAAPVQGPDTAPNASAQAAQPAAAPLGGGAAPSPVAPTPAKYNPEEALKQHLLKLHPDLEPEHLDFAARLMEAKMKLENYKKMGKEHRALLNEYYHASHPHENALHELEGLTSSHKENLKKYEEALKANPQEQGLRNPEEDQQHLGRMQALKHKVLALERPRREAWNAIAQHFEKMTGRKIHNPNEMLGRMETRHLLVPAGVDPTEDLVDEYQQERRHAP